MAMEADLEVYFKPVILKDGGELARTESLKIRKRAFYTKSLQCLATAAEQRVA